VSRRVVPRKVTSAKRCARGMLEQHVARTVRRRVQGRPTSTKHPSKTDRLDQGNDDKKVTRKLQENYKQVTKGLPDGFPPSGGSGCRPPGAVATVGRVELEPERCPRASHPPKEREIP